MIRHPPTQSEFYIENLLADMRCDRLTRRKALYLSGMAVAGLAGCQTQKSDEPPSASGTSGQPTATATEHQPTHTVDDPETRTLRNPTGKPAVRSSAHSPEQDFTFLAERESSASWDFENWLIRSRDERDALTFSQTTTGVSAAKEFIGQTDLAEETLYIQQHTSKECQSITVEQLQWGPVQHGSSVHIEYTEPHRRDHCTSTANHTTNSSSKHSEAIIVRLPTTTVTELSFAQ